MKQWSLGESLRLDAIICPNRKRRVAWYSISAIGTAILCTGILQKSVLLIILSFVLLYYIVADFINATYSYVKHREEEERK